MINQKYRSWAEINLEKLRTNYNKCCKTIGESTNFIAVVKANAYGHGDIQVAKQLSSCGIKGFAVSNIDEAKRLRCGGIKEEILILGYTPIERADELIEYGITQTLLSWDYAVLIANTGKRIKCQFAIDTGMSRIGLNANNPIECERTIRLFANTLEINGLFTHLCVADCDDDESKKFTYNQIELFEKVVSRVKDLNLKFCHCLNSAGGLWHKTSSETIVRLGIILYGLKPDYSNILPDEITPILSWKSVVSMVKEVYPGDTVGYGRTYLVDHQMKIATVPTGYADGYSRSLSNKGYVLINGNRAEIIGRICMDQMMVDISGIENVEIGTEVVLIGKSGNQCITADDLANVIGTIGYEIVCNISERVDRIYIGE